MAGKGRPGLECGVSRALDAMNETDHEVALMVLGDPDSAHLFVAQAFSELLARQGNGLVLGHTSVRDHRNGYCRCEPVEEAEAA